MGGLYSENAVERALIDEVLDSSEDVMSGYVVPLFWTKEEQRKEKADKFLAADKIPYWLNKFECRLEENEKRGNKNGYFVGDRLSIADLKFYYVVKDFVDFNLCDKEKLFAPIKRIDALMKKIAQNEDIKKFEADFVVQQNENKEKETKSFQIDGKSVYGAL